MVKPKPPIKESPVLFGRRKRPMSGAEYDRYYTTLAEASRRTRRFLIPTGNPMEPENRVNVATGGKVTSRQKFTLGGDYPKPGGTYKPKGDLPGGKKDKKNNYKGYNKGNPSPSSYGKRP